MPWSFAVKRPPSPVDLLTRCRTVPVGAGPTPAKHTYAAQDASGVDAQTMRCHGATAEPATAAAAATAAAPATATALQAAPPPMAPSAEPTALATPANAPDYAPSVMRSGENPDCCQVYIQRAKDYPDGSARLLLRFVMQPGRRWTSDRQPATMATIYIPDDQGRRSSLQTVEGQAAQDQPQLRELTGEYWFEASIYRSRNMTLRYDHVSIPFIMDPVVGRQAAGLTVSIDRGHGAMYRVGDTMTTCIRYTAAPGAF